MAYNIEENIEYQDRDILVCRKESGFPVQSARIGTPDMETTLKNYLAGKNPGKMPYLGIVQRLDQPVEGLLVFGKTPKAAAGLNRQIAGGEFEKKYLAVTKGIPAPSKGTLTDYLIRDGRSNTSRVGRENEPQAKKAVLDYVVLETANDTALVEIRLHTGRHHQIRVQMAHHGTPLQGDLKYGCTKESSSGVALCAYSLSFCHPMNNRKMEFNTQPHQSGFGEFSFCKGIKTTE